MEKMGTAQPIVIAHHLIWTAYGWWLPNDPRGSTSRAIAGDVIAELGELHYGRRAVQPASREIRQFYERAREVLKFPLLELSDGDIRQVGEAFAEAVVAHRYTCYACAIMPDHVHVLVRKHRHKAEEMIENLQEASRLWLCGCGGRAETHPVWCGGGWKVFLDSPEDVRRTIRYITQNPVKLRLPPQQWSFVREYDGWPLHPGHDPNSPYARRLRGQER
jgi:REP element-mobilizing transposase RayT